MLNSVVCLFLPSKFHPVHRSMTKVKSCEQNSCQSCAVSLCAPQVVVPPACRFKSSLQQTSCVRQLSVTVTVPEIISLQEGEVYFGWWFQSLVDRPRLLGLWQGGISGQQGGAQEAACFMVGKGGRKSRAWLPSSRPCLLPLAPRTGDQISTDGLWGMGEMDW